MRAIHFAGLLIAWIYGSAYPITKVSEFKKVTCAGSIKEWDQQQRLKDKSWRFTGSRSDQTQTPEKCGQIYFKNIVSAIASRM